MEITKELVLELYKMMAKATGGTYGIRDERSLESALASPYQTFDGTELYPSIIEKASRLCYGLTANHPFLDGNKRIGVFVMLVYLKANNINISFNDNEIVELSLGIARSELKYDDILKLLNNKL